MGGEVLLALYSFFLLLSLEFFSSTDTIAIIDKKVKALRKNKDRVCVTGN